MFDESDPSLPKHDWRRKFASANQPHHSCGMHRNLSRDGFFGEQDHTGPLSFVRKWIGVARIGTSEKHSRAFGDGFGMRICVF
jgi:hypothetical protein